uniref:Putative secreted protein n=1 Tax=Anopheles darlingi TaxID=43151 RepID=A0A2M4DIM9_ANODA
MMHSMGCICVCVCVYACVFSCYTKPSHDAKSHLRTDSHAATNRHEIPFVVNLVRWKLVPLSLRFRLSSGSRLENTTKQKPDLPVHQNRAALLRS